MIFSYKYITITVHELWLGDLVYLNTVSVGSLLRMMRVGGKIRMLQPIIYRISPSRVPSHIVMFKTGPPI